MPSHRERRRLPYSPEQLYDLVADIERYPEFLPWCLAARVREPRPPAEGSSGTTVLTGDLVIGFKMVRERFTSRVTLEPKRRIEVVAVEGPLRHLTNRWSFEDDGAGGTNLDFAVEFEFRSPILRRLIGALFHEAVRRMVAAFEGRAAQLYGDKAA